MALSSKLASIISGDYITEGWFKSFKKSKESKKENTIIPFDKAYNDFTRYKRDALNLIKSMPYKDKFKIERILTSINNKDKFEQEVSGDDYCIPIYEIHRDAMMEVEKGKDPNFDSEKDNGIGIGESKEYLEFDDVSYKREYEGTVVLKAGYIIGDRE